VVNIFIGLRERTSHTATIPSWDTTANLEPDGENAEQNDVRGVPVRCNECKFEGESNGGKVSWARRVNVICAPPIIPCGESPTERRVRSSGEIEAVHGVMPRTTSGGV
jgi:hypothetical protein